MPFPTKCLISWWPWPRCCVSCLAGCKTVPEGKQDQTTAFRPLSDDVVERQVKTTDDHLRRSFRQCKKCGTKSSSSSCWATLLQPLSLQPRGTLMWCLLGTVIAPSTICSWASPQKQNTNDYATSLLSQLGGILLCRLQHQNISRVRTNSCYKFFVNVATEGRSQNFQPGGESFWDVGGKNKLPQN